ncbi:MAG: DUF721 domain-containing protein [Candidatus Hydrogenedentes bacterium]|nr:DUF721 domain-containing protein [Candidatus Hydrogenedentota bacterium]MBI3119096.1 DUF721 domain-containing protein [Candidatus Hydrogenedentota bacterium]
MRKNTPVDVGSILEQLKQTTKLGEQLEQAVIWERWPEIAGPRLYIHGRPHSIKDGCLRIEVESSVWMNKFAYQRQHVINRINRCARRRLVEDVFLVLMEEEDKAGEEAPKKRRRKKAE